MQSQHHAVVFPYCIYAWYVINFVLFNFDFMPISYYVELYFGSNAHAFSIRFWKIWQFVMKKKYSSISVLLWRIIENWKYSLLSAIRIWFPISHVVIPKFWKINNFALSARETSYKIIKSKTTLVIRQRKSFIWSLKSYIHIYTMGLFHHWFNFANSLFFLSWSKFFMRNFEGNLISELIWDSIFRSPCVIKYWCKTYWFLLIDIENAYSCIHNNIQMIISYFYEYFLILYSSLAICLSDIFKSLSRIDISMKVKSSFLLSLWNFFYMIKNLFERL